MDTLTPTFTANSSTEPSDVWIHATLPPNNVLYQFARGGGGRGGGSGRGGSSRGWRGGGRIVYISGGSGGGGVSMAWAIGIVVAVIAAMFIAFCCIFIYTKWQDRKSAKGFKKQDSYSLNPTGVTPCTHTAFYKPIASEQTTFDSADIVLHPAQHDPTAPIAESLPYPSISMERPPCSADLPPYSPQSSNLLPYPLTPASQTCVSSTEPPPYSSPGNLPPYPSPSSVSPYPSHSSVPSPYPTSPAILPPYPLSSTKLPPHSSSSDNLSAYSSTTLPSYSSPSSPPLPYSLCNPHPYPLSPTSISSYPVSPSAPIL